MIQAAKRTIPVSNINGTFTGRLFLFRYNAKMAKILPYWDMFPLVFPIDIKQDSMLGINMHYLDLRQRLRLLDTFKKMTLTQSKKAPRVQIEYEQIEQNSSLRLAKPCLKRYLYNKIVSQLIPIAAVDWDLVISAPLDRFQKAPAETVWRDSADKIQR